MPTRSGLASKDLAIERERQLGGPFPDEGPAALAAAAAQVVGEGPILDQPLDGTGEGGRIAGVADERRITDHFGQTGSAGADDRHVCRHGLEERKSEPFFERWRSEERRVGKE